ncbi:MAG: DUF523 domain-containing protein [Oscillospiraceae bacterium]|nr:DUF523 domain-containing protein [Oscillospiraceae bacterium]MBR0208510.1 DUF523 domain-containing protein [Oscillospiraceae bacterium]
MKRLLVSACLLGACCKYSGGNNALDGEMLRALREKWALVPVCPEMAGGLGVPREPSERRGERVVSRSGADVTAAFAAGAETACRLCGRFGCETALLKENSPSCGNGTIYDGSFSGTLTAGDGLTAERLRALGLALVGESKVEELL